jgi:hypothetical protein
MKQHRTTGKELQDKTTRSNMGPHEALHRKQHGKHHTGTRTGFLQKNKNRNNITTLEWTVTGLRTGTGTIRGLGGTCRYYPVPYSVFLFLFCPTWQ